MATVKFYIRSNADPAVIFVRLTLDRENYFRKKTPLLVDPKGWDSKKGRTIAGDEVFKNLDVKLDGLATHIKEKYNESVTNKLEITNDWLQEQIDTFFGKVKVTEKDRLVNCIQGYIDYLPRKKQRNNKRGVALATIKKHQSLKVKIQAFEQYRKKTISVKDVGKDFIEELETYLMDVDRLGVNTTGRLIKFVKTICLWAGTDKKIPVHADLTQIKGYTSEAEKVFLNFDELEKIQDATFTRPALENARDWLLIGCFCGQRVSDLLKLSHHNLTVRNGLELIELTQQKTKKNVVIPMHPVIKEILDKRGGNFPYKISDVKFNEYIKDVCRLAGITGLTEGSLLVDLDERNKDLPQNQHRWRKQHGKYPKWKLVSSHVCRRSFATNLYGELPTAWIIAITAHSTEKQFLQYVGKDSIDIATQMAGHFVKLVLKSQQKPVMTVLRNAK